MCILPSCCPQLTDIQHRAVEANLIIICGCLPTFRIFLKINAPRKKKAAVASSGTETPGNGFSLQTFGQGDRRSRRQFDNISDIDAMDDVDLKNDGKEYRAMVSAHTVEESIYDGSDGGIVRTFSASARTVAGSSWNGSQEGIDRTSQLDASGPLSPTRG